ncbi:outer membrane beta-barrel protein [Tenacibaculum sp. MEBiC06402]|uniref:outer membrane beta-barrel protein n=1 Tax=unclassified Tenacibaculum TaxID=2635139 RepID=UPI003B9D7F44
MVLRRTILVLFLLFFSSKIIAQVQEQSSQWQFGLGFGIAKFSDADADYIGDKYLFQIPRLNLTIPISDKLSVDGAMSFNTFDVGFISNNVKYFSMDGSLRYNFKDLIDKFEPYVFIGGSLVDSERKMTPTMNIGAGATYWVTDNIGLNGQVYYKHSLEIYESMRSHIQLTGSIVFAFDGLFGSAGGGVSRRKSLTGGACFHNPND